MLTANDFGNNMANKLAECAFSIFGGMCEGEVGE